MRKVDYQDSKGRMTQRLVPDDAPDANARYGIVVGPPDLDSLGLPQEVEIRLHNELFNRGLLTLDDVRKRRPEIMAAVQAALKVDAESVMAAYAVKESPSG